MDFSLTDEQKMLKESAERFIERDYTFAARRELAAGELGFGRENWARFAELGWLAVALPFSAASRINAARTEFW